MTVTADSFRIDFPAFASQTTYPDSAINFWLLVATKRLDATRWADMLDVGTELFVAHNLTIDAQNARAVAAGGIAGQASGIVASKSVDKVSVAYDTGAVTYEEAGFYNLSSFGTRFWELMMIVGMGGAQL